jgi:hypothetical protein
LRANWNTSPRFGHEGDFIFSVSWTPWRYTDEIQLHFHEWFQALCVFM